MLNLNYRTDYKFFSLIDKPLKVLADVGRIIKSLLYSLF